MRLRGFETIAMVAAGLALAGISLANSARIAPVAERQRADVRLVDDWVRSTARVSPVGADAHLGRAVDRACAVTGVGGRVRVCVTVARAGDRGPARIVGGWHVPALAANTPARRYGCWGQAASMCAPAAPGGG